MCQAISIPARGPVQMCQEPVAAPLDKEGLCSSSSSPSAHKRTRGGQLTDV